MTPDEREFWSERAAIREYLGKMPRKEAERGADEDLRAWKARRR